MSGGSAPPTRDLAQRLAEAEATIAALLSGQIDAVVDVKSRTPVLLAKAQEALRVSEERYRRIVETTNEGVWLFDVANKTTFMNRRMAQMLRCEPGTEIGCSPFEFLADDQRGKLTAYLQRPYPDQVEIRLTRTDGTSLWALVETSPAFDPAGRYDGSLAMVRDVSDRRLAEAALRQSTADLGESERLYRSTFDEAPVGIVHVSLDGTGLRVNQRLCDLLGYSRDELQGVVIEDLLRTAHMADEAAAFRQMAAGTLDRHVIEEQQYRRQDGTFMWARVHMSAHRDDEGTARRMIAVIEDITERRTLEAQIRQANKMDAVGRLASGVAHDFNNLLTVILGFTELVAADVAITSQHGQDLDEVTKAARRAAALTQQLLAFSRQQVLDAAPLDVNGLISSMTGMLGRLIGEHIEISLVLEAGLHLAHADRGQLEQVVMNLVVNARDAMPDGGRVIIETATADLESSALHDETVIPGTYVKLAITDTGQGMTRDTQRRLFEPFFTTKEAGKGTGLGLSTTYGIVKQSKGYIRVDSELNRGTTFTVYLPCASRDVAGDASMATRAADQSGPLPRGTETLLVVEDEPSVRDLARGVLEAHGYAVLSAANGQEGLHAVQAHTGSPVSLVITDVIMPLMSGKVMAEWLTTTYPDLKVLFTSGYTDDAIGHHGVLDPGVEFLPKPYTPASLVRRVREMLDS
jgi:two-component system cell cycle sensor histidine kinase/response regulator CckA